VFGNYSKVELYKGKSVKLRFWDTAGQEDYDNLRLLSYKKAEMVIICYSIDSRTSLENVRKKWYLEAKGHAPNALHLILGLKTDLRDQRPKSQAEIQTFNEYDQFDGNGYRYYLAEDGYYYYYPDQKHQLSGMRKSKAIDVDDLVTYEEGRKVATGLFASAFKECSAKTGQGLKDVIDIALKVADGRKLLKSSCCTVL
jgi:GTPase SAR1 family protein